ncbi:Ldh family oxidoreductase [Catenovulum sp. SM1970]|uniref:Ldh family oxidoreductase n=1 Tax=Marinifaba aquimaris TaxID=2741323 RepID=UPI001573F48B|nr:Ldh family oxidoreductase [Marinifaba aquimaris]NTS76198.1 Ldh family oxidoreductase [Marinifaba aquimaris]
MTSHTFDYDLLAEFSQQLLMAAGAEPQVAQSIAKQLLEAELLGFYTHGLQRLVSNLTWLTKGRSKPNGEHKVITERLAVQTWDAQFSSGLYLVPKAVDTAITMAKKCGTGTVVIKQAQHVAALASYLEPALNQNMLIQIMAATPSQKAIAPYGAKQAVFSPNPFAIGASGHKHSLLIDMTLATTAASKLRKAWREGQAAPEDTLLDKEGHVTTDASSFFNKETAGAIMPLGGELYGYKGTSFCLYSELWTLALSNWGRAQQGKFGEANAVWVQVIDPTAFGDLQSFKTEVDYLVELTENAEPRPNMQVRAPGLTPLKRKQQKLTEGIQVADFVWQDILAWAKANDFTPPAWALN